MWITNLKQIQWLDKKDERSIILTEEHTRALTYIDLM